MYIFPIFPRIDIFFSSVRFLVQWQSLYLSRCNAIFTICVRQPKYYSLYEANWRFVVFYNRKNKKCEKKSTLFFECVFWQWRHWYCWKSTIRNIRKRKIRDNVIINCNANNKLVSLGFFLNQSQHWCTFYLFQIRFRCKI